MKKLNPRLWFLAAFFLLPISNLGAADQPLTRSLLPVPSSLTWSEGRLALDSNFTLALTGVKEIRVEKAAQRFLQRLSKRTGLSLSETPASPAKALLVIDCKSKGLPVQTVREDESYTLNISGTQARLSAPNPLGILHGLETLLQLIQTEKGKSYLPAAAIQDQPRFAWRGLLIDVCRHWQPVEVIQRNLDAMAEAKLNVLHWHLSENQGFRVESKKFPKLQEMGSDGNFYTQKQIQEVVAYARARGIRVVPEFDIPGHSTAWLVGYPELASAPGPYEIERKFGVFNPSFDPSNEKVYPFFDEFIGEMASLFPDEYFHIGGDEVNGKDWNQNPRIQAFMYQHGFKTKGDLQTYFNSRILKSITAHGKKMVGWDEILHPGLPKTIVVQSWRGPEALGNTAKGGYDGILSDGYYLDHMRPASDYYANDPLSPKSNLTSAEKIHVLGGEACMWSEFVTPQTIDSRIWPRTLAVAERLWSPAAVQDVDDFYRRMEIESVRLDDTGVTHRSEYLPMLQNLVGEKSAASLKVLADVVEPVKFYSRPGTRDYTSLTPLDRLVDAARPESRTARDFTKAVNQTLINAPQLEGIQNLQTSLQLWKDNHRVLEPVLEKSDKTVELENQSKDLSESARLGLEALTALQSGRPTSAAWQLKAKEVLDRAQQAQAEVEIAVIPAIRKLVLASGQWEQLKKTSAKDWNKSLDDQVAASKPKHDWW